MLRSKAIDVELARWGMNAKNTKSEAHATCSDDGSPYPDDGPRALDVHVP